MTATMTCRERWKPSKRKIVPLDAQVLARSGPVQGNLSITATWDIETKIDRGEYSQWVTCHLVPEFKAVRADDSQLTFSKTTEGDTNSIECKFALTNAKLHILATYSVSPDELWRHPWLADLSPGHKNDLTSFLSYSNI